MVSFSINDATFRSLSFARLRNDDRDVIDNTTVSRELKVGMELSR